MPRPLLALFVLTAAVATSAPAADLTIRDRVVPDGPIVRLGDIATIHRATPEQASQLAATPLMPAPAPGTKQVVRTQEIRDLLVALGVDLNELRFAGANRVTIGQALPERPLAAKPEPVAEPAPLPTAAPKQQSGFRLVSEAPARATSRTRRGAPRLSGRRFTEVEEQLAALLSEYVVEQSGDPMFQATELDLPARNASSFAQAISPAEVSMTEPLALGRQRFLVSFSTAEGPVRFPVLAVVSQATPMVVAAAPISRGDTLTAANLKVIPSDGQTRVAPGETLLSDIDEALGKESSRQLRPGQPVTDANCLQPTMVRRGDLVTVQAGGGGLRVSLKCKCRKDGRYGEMVEVETIDDRRRLEARVIGPGELAVLATAGATQSNYLAGQERSRRTR